MERMDRALDTAMERVSRHVQDELAVLLCQAANTNIDLSHPQFCAIAARVSKAAAAVVRSFKESAIELLLPHLNLEDDESGQPGDSPLTTHTAGQASLDPSLIRVPSPTAAEGVQSTTLVNTDQDNSILASSEEGPAMLRSASSATRLLSQCTPQGLALQPSEGPSGAAQGNGTTSGPDAAAAAAQRKILEEAAPAGSSSAQNSGALPKPLTLAAAALSAQERSSSGAAAQADQQHSGNLTKVAGSLAQLVVSSNGSVENRMLIHSNSNSSKGGAVEGAGSAPGSALEQQQQQYANPAFLKTVHAALSAANLVMGDATAMNNLSETIHRAALMNREQPGSSPGVQEQQMGSSGAVVEAGASVAPGVAGDMVNDRNSGRLTMLHTAGQVPTIVQQQQQPQPQQQQATYIAMDGQGNIVATQGMLYAQQQQQQLKQQHLQQQLQQLQQQQQQYQQAAQQAQQQQQYMVSNMQGGQQTVTWADGATLQTLQGQTYLTHSLLPGEGMQGMVPMDTLLLSARHSTGAAQQHDGSSTRLGELYSVSNQTLQPRSMQALDPSSATALSQEALLLDPITSQYSPEPNFSLFDLQPTSAQASGYLPQGAQQLSIYASGNPSDARNQHGTSPQSMEFNGNPALNALGYGNVVGSGGHLISLAPGSNQSMSGMPAMQLGIPADQANEGTHSEPLPMMVNLGHVVHHQGGVLAGGLGMGQLMAVSGPAGMPRLSTGAPNQLTGLAAMALPRQALQSISISPLPVRPMDLPGRFKVLPLLVQQRILALCRSNPVITVRDFDDKVVSKLSLLVDSWGMEQALAMLDHLEHRMRTKQGAMKNGPGYLDVAVCSHLDMLKAQGACPKSMKLEDYAQQVLAPAVFHELCEAVNNNRWLAWEHFDQGIIQLVKKLPPESAVEKLQEITYHSFKNVDNIKGCIMSILNSKIREDRRRQ